MGIPIVLMLKPDPVTDAWLRVTAEPPVLVRVAEDFWLVPTLTVPKETGLELSCPGVVEVACVPTPTNATVTVSLVLCGCDRQDP